ncbi:MAG TPA: hypothetical protein DCS93_39795 [Microscillaceae bacterium]|nr:hypothetical protein [Microscillaceae bacterium]
MNQVHSSNTKRVFEYYTNVLEELELETILLEDYQKTSDFLIVAGFSTLDFLLCFFGKERISDDKKVRVVLGNEPRVTEGIHQKSFLHTKLGLSQEIQDYWLNRGISPMQSANVLYLIENIKDRRVNVRILNNLCAKAYISDTGAIMGSSNFSRGGLRNNFEINRRFDSISSYQDYSKVKKIANEYFELGEDYNDQLVNLLEKLLHYVNWQEALARAVAELQEGGWLKNYPEFLQYLNKLEQPLWKTQIEAIGQALYILDNNGSLLIADPTGSGKTKMGVVLQACILNRFFQKAINFIKEDRNALLICPPQVQGNWQREYRKIKDDFNNSLSQGRLSVSAEDTQKEVEAKIANARILYIDEAHNFLNKHSNRSIKLQNNLANNIVLYTATPINKKARDLFRLVEILDIDNLSDEAIKEYKRLKAFSNKRNLHPNELQQLQGYIQDFMVRRTKKELNQKIQKHPDAYRNKLGDKCSYPKQNCLSYNLEEKKNGRKDAAIAYKINRLAGKLKGLYALRKFNMSPEVKKSLERQRKFLEASQNRAKALAIYTIQAMLRSSSIALIEHVRGTDEAKSILRGIGYALPPKFKKDNETGNIVSQLKKHRKTLPEQNFDEGVKLPEWMTNKETYEKVIDEELSIYEEIFSLAKKMDHQREIKKAEILINKVHKHELLLAFDSRPISLHFIASIAKKKSKDINFLVVTGDNKTAKKEALEIFKLGSSTKNVVGLCSDAMAEGLNLQQASAMILLDTPSVMRIAEQRIGRIDRMDSSHDSIDIYFPDDHDAFALKTDRKFYLTAQLVDALLGSNLELPNDLLEKWKVKKTDFKKLYEENIKNAEETFRDGITNAFKAAEGLVGGETAIVDQEIYENIRKSEVTLISKVGNYEEYFPGVEVSKVNAKQEFGFFCIRGSKDYAPYWLYVDETTLQDKRVRVIRHLPTICEKLRENLQKTTENIEPADYIEKEEHIKQRFIGAIQEYQLHALPNKKKRVIKLLHILLSRYSSMLFDQSKDRLLLIDEIQKLLRSKPEINIEYQLDYDRLAQICLKFFQPRLMQFRADPKNTGTIYLMDDNFVDYLTRRNPINDQELETLKREIPVIQPIEKRIAACIIGLVLPQELQEENK